MKAAVRDQVHDLQLTMLKKVTKLQRDIEEKEHALQIEWNAAASNRAELRYDDFLSVVLPLRTDIAEWNASLDSILKIIDA